MVPCTEGVRVPQEGNLASDGCQLPPKEQRTRMKIEF